MRGDKTLSCRTSPCSYFGSRGSFASAAFFKSMAKRHVPSQKSSAAQPADEISAVVFFSLGMSWHHQQSAEGIHALKDALTDAIDYGAQVINIAGFGCLASNQQSSIPADEVIYRYSSNNHQNNIGPNYLYFLLI